MSQRPKLQLPADESSFLLAVNEPTPCNYVADVCAQCLCKQHHADSSGSAAADDEEAEGNVLGAADGLLGGGGGGGEDGSISNSSLEAVAAGEALLKSIDLTKSEDGMGICCCTAAILPTMYS